MLIKVTNRLADFFWSMGLLTIFVLFCSGVGSCKKWQYDECLAVGHSASYCSAQIAGCFNSSKGRRR